jgi:Mg2+/Co2+ transporter CorB
MEGVVDGIDWSLWLTALAIVVLLIGSGFFSATETAMTAASEAKLHQIAQDGDRRAVRVNKLRSSKDKLIGTLLLGNNVINILASALATSVLIRLFGDAGVVYATFVMTVLVLVFAEVLPKTYALLHADRLALAVSGLTTAIVYVLSPITTAIAWIVRGTLRLFGAHAVRVRLGIDPEELRGAIEMHRGEDDEVSQERAMLRSILDLNDVVVSEIMTHRRNVVMIDIDQPVSQLIDQVLASPHTRLPLFRGNPDNALGVLHVKQLMREVQQRGDDLSKLDPQAIAAKPWFIPESTTLFDQLHEFRRRREHFAIVVDEYGSFMGIVTLEDILEEIVGDIEDEHDVKVAGVRAQADGSFIVDGTVTIRDLNRQYEWGLPDDQASTVAGLVLHEARRIPEAGQSFTFHGFRFDILRRHRHQITSLRITPKPTID